MGCGHICGAVIYGVWVHRWCCDGCGYIYGVWVQRWCYHIWGVGTDGAVIYWVWVHRWCYDIGVVGT